MTNMTDPNTCPTRGVNLVLAGVLLTEGYFLKFTREMVGGAAVEGPVCAIDDPAADPETAATAGSVRAGSSAAGGEDACIAAVTEDPAPRSSSWAHDGKSGPSVRDLAPVGAAPIGRRRLRLL